MKISNKKLKILMFNRWVGYNEGGNETHIKELAVFLSKNGHKIDILTTGNEALQGIKMYLRNIIEVPTPKEYFSYNSKRFYYSFKYLVDSFIILDNLIRVKKIKYDVITAHFSLEAFLLRFIRLIYKIPYVLILVGDTDLELIEGKRANNVSQLTHYMAKECIYYGYYPEILTKGVDQSRFKKKLYIRTLRKKYIKNAKQFLILTVCRLDPRKNLETLIKAAYALEKKYKNIFKFIIVGDGVESSKLQQLVKKLKLTKSVFFAGAVSSTSSELPEFYSIADVFALPTLYEGFGYVYSEAMSFGIPVIGTETSAVTEVLEDVGILIPMRSPNKLAEALHTLYIDKELYSELSKKSLDRVKAWYWENLITKYEKFIYKGIANFEKESDITNRIISFSSSLFLDIPLMLYIIVVTLTRPANKWGSIFRKE